ncbi:hypothetical protein ACVIJX_007063 [Bradyrhizobium diazoefficiens]
MNDGDAGEVDRLERLLEGRAVLHHHHGRLDQVEQIFQLDVIVAHQRVGRRHGSRRNARLHRGLCHQRMLDRVAGHDRDRAAIETEIEQALRQCIHGALGFAVRDLPPFAVRSAALGEPDALGCLRRPFRQRGRDVLLVRLQRNARLQHHRAVAAALDVDVACQPLDLAKGGLRHHRRRAATHFASPGITVLCGSSSFSA